MFFVAQTVLQHSLPWHMAVSKCQLLNAAMQSSLTIQHCSSFISSQL